MYCAWLHPRIAWTGKLQDGESHQKGEHTVQAVPRTTSILPHSPAACAAASGPAATPAVIDADAATSRSHCWQACARQLSSRLSGAAHTAAAAAAASNSPAALARAQHASGLILLALSSSHATPRQPTGLCRAPQRGQQLPERGRGRVAAAALRWWELLQWRARRCREGWQRREGGPGGRRRSSGRCAGRRRICHERRPVWRGAPLRRWRGRVAPLLRLLAGPGCGAPAGVLARLGGAGWRGLECRFDGFQAACTCANGVGAGGMGEKHAAGVLLPYLVRSVHTAQISWSNIGKRAPT